MSESWCDRLEDYLDARLSAADRAAFERHVESCVECARAIGVQQRVDRLLAAADAELGVVPRELAARIEQRMAVESRRVAWRRGMALATAASLLAAAGVWYGWTDRGRETGPARVERSGRAEVVPDPVESSGSSAGSSGPIVRLVFDAKSDAIAVPIESGDPKVSIFWVYPISAISLESEQDNGDSPGISSGT